LGAVNKTLRANFNLQHESLIVEKPDCGIKVYAVDIVGGGG